MKFGEKFEKLSVPQWSLHNIDYNSLKHHIKVHTTKDQATAIAIPGRRDSTLGKFEDEFYLELCRQHDRVHLFVTSKADEVARRLQHLSSQIHRLILRCATSSQQPMSIKRRQRFAKYEQELLKCGDDFRSLERFVSAQAIAFRKILKKYRKWTGSSALGSRFKDNVLADHKSFTRFDFSQLQAQYNGLTETLHAALPPNLDLAPRSPPGQRRSPESSTHLSPNEAIVPGPRPAVAGGGYWNEYDYGSEAGDLDPNVDTDYAIYIDPNDDVSFPGMKALDALFVKPVKKLGAWMFPRSHDTAHADADADADADGGERGPLLPTHADGTPYGSTRANKPPPGSYFTTPPGGTTTNTTTSTSDPLSSSLDTDDEAPYRPFPHRHTRRGSHSGYASSLDELDQSAIHAGANGPRSLPPGYRAHSSSSSSSCTSSSLLAASQHRRRRLAARYRACAVAACFAVALVLTAVAGVLVAVASRHRNRRLRVEIDAGVTLAIVTALGLACAALCLACSSSPSSFDSDSYPRATGGRVSGKGGRRRRRRKLVCRVVVGVLFAGICVANGVLLVAVMGRTV